MKSLPAYIALTTLAALVLLAVVSSVNDSVPFVMIATYLVSSACSLGVVGLFLGDYTRRAPQLNLSLEKVREVREVAPVVPRDLLSTMGLHNDPATLSYS